MLSSSFDSSFLSLFPTAQPVHLMSGLDRKRMALPSACPYRSCICAASCLEVWQSGPGDAAELVSDVVFLESI